MKFTPITYFRKRQKNFDKCRFFRQTKFHNCISIDITLITPSYRSSDLNDYACSITSETLFSTGLQSLKFGLIFAIHPLSLAIATATTEGLAQRLPSADRVKFVLQNPYLGVNISMKMAKLALDIIF